MFLITLKEDEASLEQYFQALGINIQEMGGWETFAHPQPYCNTAVKPDWRNMSRNSCGARSMEVEG